MCLEEQRSADCGIQVWSIQEKGHALGALLLSVKATLTANVAGLRNRQQLLAVSSAE